MVAAALELRLRREDAFDPDPTFDDKHVGGFSGS
jgi:hypothetical protein